MTLLTTILFLGVFLFGLWSVVSPLVQHADRVLVAMAGPQPFSPEDMHYNVIAFEGSGFRGQEPARLAA